MEKERKTDYCFDCDEDTEYIVKEISGTFRVKDKDIKATIFEARCSKCGARMIVDEVQHKNEMILFEAYKKESGLMTAEELKALRSKYGLSAVAFAKVLGLGEKNVTRYENGAVQSDSINRYFMMAKNDGAFWECYHNHSTELTPAEREKSDRAFILYIKKQIQLIMDEADELGAKEFIIESFKRIQKQQTPFDYQERSLTFAPLNDDSKFRKPTLI